MENSRFSYVVLRRIAATVASLPEPLVRSVTIDASVRLLGITVSGLVHIHVASRVTQGKLSRFNLVQVQIHLGIGERR